MAYLRSTILTLLFLSTVQGDVTDCITSCAGKSTTDGQRYPYCGDCHKYAFCDDSGMIIKNCPSGLNFNAAENDCDLIANAVCGTTTSSTTTSTTATTTTSTTTTTTAAPPCYTECTDGMAGNRRYPVCSSCSHYLECNAGAAEIHECPSGLYHNDAEQDCDLATNVVCDWTTTSSTTTATTTTVKILTTAPPGVCVQNCNNVAISNMRYPHCSDCTKYVQCLSSGFTETQCPGFLYHNDAIQDCDMPAQTTCYATTSSTSTTTTADLNGNTGPTCVSDCSNKANGDYQSCETCYGYVSCSNGYLYKRPCTANLVWDDAIQNCVFKPSSTCVEP